jgi:uncharacterized membrane-anchored protein
VLKAFHSRRPAPLVGVARVDRRTKDLAKRIRPGEIAVVDHSDLDRVAADSLVAAGISGIVNAAQSITGRYPNTGPLMLSQAGIPILDGVGPDVMDLLADGQVVEIVGDTLLLNGQEVARGGALTEEVILERLDAAKTSMGAELERFAANTLKYIQSEGHLLIDDPTIPDVPVDFKDRHVLIVVRGIDYKDDLELLRRTGYLAEMKPLLVGVDGGADALLDMGHVPDVIIGDFDSVSERALGCGAVLVVHGYRDGRAPGAERLVEQSREHVVFASEGTSEDIAMLLAYERGAELIVAVGTHNSMAEFLDKGRGGMASTFLVRMKVGPVLVDAKGVSQLYEGRVRTRDLLLPIGAAVAAMFVVGLTSDPLQTFFEALWLYLRNLWLSITG